MGASDRPPLPPLAAAAAASAKSSSSPGGKAAWQDDIESARPVYEPMSKKIKVAMWVAVVVLVVSAGGAIAVGVTQGITKSGGGGGSSSSGSSSTATTSGSDGTGAAAAPAAAAVLAPTAAATPLPNSTSKAPAATPASSAPTPQGPPLFLIPDGFVPLFWDEFDGSSLDLSRWTVVDGPNKQQGAKDAPSSEGLQTYTSSPDNLQVVNGSLLITARRAADGSATPFTSARVSSLPAGTWYPGMKSADGTKCRSIHVAARIQLPQAGQGLHAALWMNPVQQQKFGSWPASGEIDIMAAANQMDEVVQSIHYGGPWPDNDESEVSTMQDGDKPFSSTWNIFSLDWEREKITVKVNSAERAAWSGWWTSGDDGDWPAPFNKPFSLVMNIAVGGSFPGPPDATTPDSATMAVDWIRVFGRLADD